MLANGGELDGVRVLGRKTVELMSTNHIGDRNVDLAVGPNYGFGFGVCVRKGIGGTEARRMIRVPLDLRRPSLVALGQQSDRRAPK